jgi:hypothetical protein
MSSPFRALTTTLLLASKITLALVCGPISFAHAARGQACQFVFSDPKAEALAHLEKAAADTRSHRLVFENDRATLKIGLLDANDRQFSVALLKAMKIDALSIIDAGEIVGPKVLSVLAGLPELAPADSNLTIRGHLSPALLSKWMHEYYQQSQTTEAIHKGKRNVDYFTKADVDRFNESVEVIKLDEACRQIYNANIQNCGKLRFIYSSARKEFVWMTDGSSLFAE